MTPDVIRGQKNQLKHRRNAILEGSVIVWLIFILVVSSASVNAQSPQEVAKKAFNSTVLLVMADANGRPLSMGSGFLVSSGEIATNFHVVEGSERGYAKLVGQGTKYDIEGFTAIDQKRDLVVLKISSEGSTNLTLGNSDTVQVGESVYAVGNPQGLEGTFSQGIISSIREVGTDRLLQITAPISPGSSGGPVLNGKGEVIGVSVATFQGGQNLNFAIPSNYLKGLIGNVSGVKPLAHLNKTKSERSVLAGFGGKSSEGVVGGQFLWDSLDGRYSFSLHNQLQHFVQDIVCNVVFYDRQNIPVEYDQVFYGKVISPGLSKRVESRVPSSIRTLTSAGANQRSQPKVEFRVLYFKIRD